MAKAGIRGRVAAAPEKEVLDYISSRGYDPWVKFLYIKFGKLAGRKRLRILEAEGKIVLSGRGGNRRIRLVGW